MGGGEGVSQAGLGFGEGREAGSRHFRVGSHLY